MRNTQILLALAFTLTSLTPLVAQLGGREPLNEKEIDQLRETAQEPEKRLKLMVDFARARLATIEQMRGDPRFAAGRGQRVHDLLQDFTKLMDEIGDNLDDYAAHQADLRKPLKVVIEGSSEFQLKLRTLKEQGPGSGDAAKNEPSDYRFALQDAIEAVNTNLDDARKLLADQELAFKEAKEKAKKKK